MGTGHPLSVVGDSVEPGRFMDAAAEARTRIDFEEQASCPEVSPPCDPSLPRYVLERGHERPR
jgi:hypothetical protein